MNSTSCASVQILDCPFPKTKFSVCGLFSVRVSCVAYEPAFPWLCGFIFDNSELRYLEMRTFAVIRKIHVACASNTTVGVLNDLWIWDPLLSSFNQNQAERLFARRKLSFPNLTRLEGRQPSGPQHLKLFWTFFFKAIFKISNFKVASKFEEWPVWSD